MKAFATILIFLSSTWGWAATYRCTLTQFVRKGAKPAELWSGELTLENGKKHSVDAVIVGSDGKGVPLLKVVDEGGISGLRPVIAKRLKPYDGAPVVSLLRDGDSIRLSIGHVNSFDAEYAAPPEAIASTGAAAKALEVDYVERKLRARCARVK